MNYRIPLAFDTFGEAEKNALIEVLESGHYTQGKCVSTFESQFADYLGVDFAVMVNSGSSANLIAISAVYYATMWNAELTPAPLQPGDEVIVPGLSWPTTLTPLLNLRLRPVFCDIELDSLNLSVRTVDEMRTERTRAVIAVPVLGNPTGLVELREYCRGQRLLLIEDAAESLGAETEGGEKVGSFGLVAGFSFYFSHHISTIEGGAVVTNSPLIADLSLALRSHGWTRQLSYSELADNLPEFEEVDSRFCFFLPGYNVRATELSGAIGSVQLARLPDFLARRRAIAEARIEALKPYRDRVTIPGAQVGTGHSWMTFPMLLDTPARRDAIRAALEARGIETRAIIAGNILRQPLSRFLDLRPDQLELPACDEVFRRGMMLGLNPQSTKTSEEYLWHAICEALEEACG